MPSASSWLAIAIGLAIGVLIGAARQYVQHKARTWSRPLGVVFIAVFQVGFGVILLGVLALMAAEAIANFEQLQAELKRSGTSAQSMLPALLTTGATSLIGGWGLLRGTGWGWRLTMFAIGLGIARNLLAMGLDSVILEQQGAAFFYSQHLVRTAFNVTMLIYLYRVRVLQHCSLSLAPMSHLLSLVVSVVLSFALEIGLRLLR
jgi:hypothetical protein